MGIMNQITVAVSGGSPEENRQVASLIHGNLQDIGFTNVTIDEESKAPEVEDNATSIADLMRAFNPDLFDIPVIVEATDDGDVVESPSPVNDEAVLDGLYQ